MSTDQKLRVHPTIRARARELRHPQTPAEAKLWVRLRDRQLGYKFRRQHPIGQFIVDFCCADRRLVVEIDGDTHETQVDYDAARTEWLSVQDYNVIRFTNQDILYHLDSVLTAILAACMAIPSPCQGEGRVRVGHGVQENLGEVEDAALAPHPNPLPAGEREKEQTI